MKRFLSLFLTVLIWRDSSGVAVWNQKPAHYWQGPCSVPQLVQGSGTWTQVPQAEASVSASPDQRVSYDQSASGPSWFGSSGQWIHPATQLQTFKPVPQTVQVSGAWTQGSQSAQQAGSRVSAFPSQQQRYDQSASWVPLQVQGVSPSQGQPSTAVQSQLTRPVPATSSVANLYTTAQGTYGLQSSSSPSWDTQPQKPSTVSTQFQPSRNVGQLLQGATSSGSSKWYKVMPPGLNPSWGSVTPPAWVPATNNLYSSLSQVASPSADAMFPSAGLGSAFQLSTSGSQIFSQPSSVSASVTSSRALSSGVLPLQNLGVSTQGPLTWPSTGSSQSVLQGGVSIGPVVQPNPPSRSPSRLSLSHPGSTSSFNFVPGPNSQASSPYAQSPALRVTSNQQTFNMPVKTSGASVSPGFSSSVKG